MQKPVQIHDVTLNLAPLGPDGGHVLAVLPMGRDGRMARVHLHGLPAEAALLPEGTGGVLRARRVDDGAVIDMLCDDAGRLRIPVEGSDLTLPVEAAATDLLAGRDVILGHCNTESVTSLRDWLIWHARHHNADGALVIERGAPGQAAEKARALAAMPDLAEALAGMVVVIVDLDLPLGEAGRGHESHPMNAPDAPGKDRIATPDPDPWHAPLACALLFDMMRQRFLAEARGVANLEVMDLVAPPEDGTGLFDRARLLPLGLLPLRGARVYPWGLRKDAEATFADHICTRFDGVAREWRWCVAPAALPEGTIWMRNRILGAKPGSRAHPFWRFMALRHGREGDAAIGQIVPKTSLVEDPTLLALSLSAGHAPVRQPRDLPAEIRADEAGRPLGDRVAIVTTMKNEGPFILEWLAYHRAIGVRDFLIYTNDCTDRTDDFLRLLDRKGLCVWRDNPYRSVDMKPQHAALDAANDEPVIRGADWAICMDVDEYIAVHVGEGRLADLFAAVPEANLISLTWRLFGNNDIDRFEDAPITQTFTRCAREVANKPHQAWGFKTLYRNIGLFRKLGVHRPKGLLPQAVDRINWVNGSGRAMPRDQWRNAWRSHSGTYGYDLVSLNHYAVRSAESFLVKRDRGRVNHVDRDQGLAYWFRMNHNVVEDTRMHRMAPLLQAEMEALLADPEIRAAHEGCVAAHRAKIDELKAQPRYQAFHAELTGGRMRRLSRLHGHFGSNIYLAGPEVIPDHVLDMDPESDFFFTVDTVEETQH